MRRALRVAPTGAVTTIDLDAPDALSRAVGGAVASRDISLMLRLYANTENRDAPNAVASHVFRAMYGADVRVFGPVVFAGSPDEEGTVRALASGWEKSLRKVAASLADADTAVLR